MLNKNKTIGVLIDLDLTIKIDDRHASGVPIFMVIGVLVSETHDYMDGLESSFRVLF